MYFTDMPKMLYDFEMAREWTSCQLMIPGQPYAIYFSGNSDFTLAGAENSDIGTQFIATTPIPGTGQVRAFTNEDVTGTTTVNKKRKVMLVTDITHNVRFRKEILQNISLYDEYDIKDGETPEILSEKLYGTPNYHWILMLANQRYDYMSDWPLSTYNLEEHITLTYGVGNEYDVHHYVDDRGYIVDADNVAAYPVSNYEYEDRLNESKRRIKIISNDLINTILKNYKDLI
jgi:hypothetical protein